MPNKKSENNKLKLTMATKKFLSTLLSVIILLSSGAMVFSLNSQASVCAAASLKYFNDEDSLQQTRMMMDGDNLLITDYWMEANITRVPVSETQRNYSAVLRFTIPDYDPSRLKFYLLNKDATMPIDVTEHVLTTTANNCCPFLCLSGLTDTSYEIHAYVDSLNEDNFVAKAEFSCIGEYGGWGICSSQAQLLGACGAPIDPTGYLRLGVAKPWNNKLGPHQYLLALPTNVIPYNSSTVKVVFFASDRNGEPVNIDKCLYDYVYRGKLFQQQYNDNTEFLVFAPDAQWGTDPSVQYEAHFYRDEVKPENFICKAVNINNSQS